jgi:heme/copper-type cytochrome/quinol oxidase subunit 2
MTTTFAPTLLIVWAVFALVTGVLYAYRASLTRDEEGQIFLDDAFAHEKAIQTEIVSKVTKLQPALRVSLVLTVLMTAVVIGYYSWGAYKALFG